MQLPLHSPEANLHSFAHILLHVESQCSLERTFKDRPTPSFQAMETEIEIHSGTNVCSQLLVFQGSFYTSFLVWFK